VVSKIGGRDRADFTQPFSRLADQASVNLLRSSLLLGRRRHRLPLLGVVFGVAAAGCAPVAPPVVPKYVEPPPTAPHAIVMVSATHLVEPGSQLDMHGAVESQIVMRSRSARQQPVVVRVQPGGTTWHFASRFFHTEWQWNHEYVDYQDTERDPCGTRDSRGNCESTSRTVTRSRLELVKRLVEVEDAHCLENAAYSLEAGRSYRISYSFRGDEQCGSTCLDVTDDPAGSACAKPVVQAAPPRTAGAAPVAAASSQGGPLHTPGTALVVLGAMGLVAGATALGYAYDRKQAVDGHCDANRVCDSDGLAAAQQGKTAGTVATVGFGAGAAMLGTGIAFLVFGPSAKSAAAVAPAQGGAQLTFQGSF
jgi:hypothetical protein